MLFAEWLASLDGTLDVTTIANYEMYVRAHFLPYFATLNRLTTASCSDYSRARLRRVQATTLRKELSALRGFVAWLVEQGVMSERDAPTIKGPTRKTTGTPNDARRKVGGWVGLTPEEAERIIALLPEHGRRNRPIRAFLHAVITGNDCPAFDPEFPGWICPLVAIREVDRYVAGTGRHKLENVCKRWGVELDGAHRALSDATAAGKLLFRLLERKAIRSCSLRSMLETTERKRAAQERDFQEHLARKARKEGAA